MASRRSFDRVPLDSRSYREPRDGRFDRTDLRTDRYGTGVESRDGRYDSRFDGRYDSRFDRYDRPRTNLERSPVQSELDRDFAAMKRVWQMLRAGAVRMVGEIGRQY